MSRLRALLRSLEAASELPPHDRSVGEILGIFVKRAITILAVGTVLVLWILLPGVDGMNVALALGIGLLLVVATAIFAIYVLGYGQITAGFGKFFGIAFEVPRPEPTPIDPPVQLDSEISTGVAIFDVDHYKDESGPVFDSLMSLISNGKRNQNESEQLTLWIQAMRGHEEIAKATMDITEALGGFPFAADDQRTKKIIWQIALKRINIAVNIYRPPGDQIFVSFKAPPSKGPDPPTELQCYYWDEGTPPERKELELSKIPIAGSFSGLAYTQRKLVYVANVNSRDVSGTIDRDLLQSIRGHIVSVFAWPIVLQNEVLGVLKFDCNRLGALLNNEQTRWLLQKATMQFEHAMRTALLLTDSVRHKDRAESGEQQQA